MSEPILFAKGHAPACAEVFLLPAMANRHGLIAGATGTGKTVTLQALAQAFSDRGVPVFLADVKGDLAGISQPGGGSEKVKQRILELGITDFTPAAVPVTFWDVFGASGHPMRTTISEMGPLLLARLLNLNDTQAGVLTLVFKIADDHGLLLLDLKDLRAMVQHVGEHAGEFTTEYGNVSPASIGAIQRNLLGLEQQGADRFFGEPALNPDDFLQTDAQGRGVVNVLAADKLMQAPKVYATLLLWLLSELFERLPEAGDLAQPKLVFFFDEAHLLFKDLSNALQEKIEQVVRLIRSKGVGVYFVTQSPRDVPAEVLAQLGNRVQHNLRAFTPEDLKAVKSSAQTFRANPEFDTADAMTQLSVGEALISTLDDHGQPNVVQRAFVIPPRSQLGPISTAQRTQLIQASAVFGAYEKTIDRESAYEKLKGAAQNNPAAQATPKTPEGALPGAPEVPAERAMMNDTLQKALGLGSAVWNAGRTSSRSDSIAQSMAKSVMRSVGTQIARGIMGSIFGGTRRR